MDVGKATECDENRGCTSFGRLGFGEEREEWTGEIPCGVFGGMFRALYLHVGMGIFISVK